MGHTPCLLITVSAGHTRALCLPLQQWARGTRCPPRAVRLLLPVEEGLVSEWPQQLMPTEAFRLLGAHAWLWSPSCDMCASLRWGFSAAEQSILWIGEFFAVGTQLCIAGCRAASRAPTQQRPHSVLIMMIQDVSQVATCPLGAQLLQVENHHSAQIHRMLL